MASLCGDVVLRRVGEDYQKVASLARHASVHRQARSENHFLHADKSNGKLEKLAVELRYKGAL